MTLFGRLFNASLEDPEVPISSANVVELFGGELKNDAGVDVNEKKALGIMAVWCAVTLISGTIASLPLPRSATKSAPLNSAGSRSSRH